MVRLGVYKLHSHGPSTISPKASTCTLITPEPRAPDPSRGILICDTRYKYEEGSCDSSWSRWISSDPTACRS